MSSYQIINAKPKEEEGVKEYTYAQKYRVYPDGRMFPIGSPFPIGNAKKIMPVKKPKRKSIKAKSPVIGEVREL
jgi:hypothetical protein